jgi:ribosomal protein S18 acetylase RimI-like enzyme
MLSLGDTASLRLAKLGDLTSLLEVCLKTADSGKDGTNLYNLRDLVGEINVSPYVLHEPNFAYSMEIDNKVVGYVLGVLDTNKFESTLHKEYWPTVKAKYANNLGDITESDKTLLDQLLKIGFTSSEIVKTYPSHLHIDIVESGQGNGYGKIMINHMVDQLKKAGSTGVHLHVASKNFRAQEFYKKLNFTIYSTAENENIMGLAL